MNIHDLGFVGVSTLIVIVYLICTAIKATNLNHKWLPVIAGASGAVLGVVGMYVMPDFPAEDVLTAVAVGIVSGFASTGVHQLFKQQNQPDGSGDPHA